MDSSYLVTGGAGFIGSHTVDALLEQGSTVTVLDVVPQDKAVNLHHVMDRITYIEGDITNPAHVTKAMKGIDYVVHLAAVVSVPLSIEQPIQTHQTNVDGALNVFQVAEEQGVKRLVYASSAAVYGNTENLPVTEDQPLNPLSPYALHKSINEQYAGYYSGRGKVAMVGLRYFNVFGPRQDPSSAYSGVISLCQKHLLDGTTFTIFGDGEQTRDFVSVYDVARANILALAEGRSGEVYNIATGTEISLNRLIDEIHTISDKTLTVEYGESRAGDILRSCSSIKKAQVDFLYAPQYQRIEVLKQMVEKG